MTRVNIKRACAGCYEAVEAGNTVNPLTVDIDYFSTASGATFTGWIARARWDRYLMSDPVGTYREAKSIARSMIAEERGSRS